MGHTMGLMHNMKASQLHTPEELADPNLTYKTGLIGSVMDYPAINLNKKKTNIRHESAGACNMKRKEQKSTLKKKVKRIARHY